MQRSIRLRARTSPEIDHVSDLDNSAFSVPVDGWGRVWVSDLSHSSQTRAGCVTVFSNSGALISTANSSYRYMVHGVMPNPFAPRGALESSRNLWSAGRSITTIQSLVDLMGIAAPVVIPLSVASIRNRLGVLP
jgi:hypothetical protein